MEFMKKRRFVRVVVAALLLTMTSWLLPAELMTVKAEAATQLKDPRRVVDPSLDAGQKVTWDCIWFGSYPQREVIADESSYDAIFRGDGSYTGYYNKDTDVIEDAALFSKLEKATGWDSNGDITISGSKYRRMKKSDGTYGTSRNNERYNWKDDTSYHYFKYEPIKWRVLDVNGSDAFLLADRALDAQPYNKEMESITWEKSTIRSWLNGYGSSENTRAIDYTGSNFINSAFTSSQRNAVKTTDVVNNDNTLYDTDVGNDTKDKVFLLAESEVYGTVESELYGLHFNGEGLYLGGRVSKSSTYAKAMGVRNHYYFQWRSGNCYWWLRTPGSDTIYAVAMGSDGDIYPEGACVNDSSYAVRPALHLDISTSDLWSYAGTVCSDGTDSEVGGGTTPSPDPSPSKPAVTEEQLKDICEELKKEFDFILVDCPAGIEQGFQNAVAGASEAIVVTTPEMSAVRDADRIIGLLEAREEIKSYKLLLNRVRPNMIKSQDMMSVDDVVEILSAQLIGIIPEDTGIITSTNKGEPIVNDEKSLAGQAYRNVAKRIIGEDVPFLNLEEETGVVAKVKKFFAGLIGKEK